MAQTPVEIDSATIKRLQSLIGSVAKDDKDGRASDLYSRLLPSISHILDDSGFGLADDMLIQENGQWKYDKEKVKNNTAAELSGNNLDINNDGIAELMFSLLDGKIEEGENGEKVKLIFSKLMFSQNNKFTYKSNFINSNMNKFETAMKVLDFFCGNTIKQWELICGGSKRTNKDHQEHIEKDTTKEDLITHLNKHLKGGAISVTNLHTYKNPEYTSDKKQDFMQKHVNIFLLFTFLNNFGVSANDYKGTLVIEPVEDYIRRFKTVMEIPTSESFDVKNYGGFLEFVSWCIAICNDNTEIINKPGVRIYRSDNGNNFGVFGKFMRTSPRIFNVQLTAPGSPYHSWMSRSLSTVKYVFDTVGSPVPTSIRNVYLPIYGGGANNGIGGLSFEDIVKKVKGTTDDIGFIGGSRVRNNNSGLYLIANLENYYKTIKSTLRSQNLELDGESDRLMKKLLDDIKVLVLSVEDTLSNLANWSKLNNMGEQRGTKITIEEMLTRYADAMEETRQKMNELQNNVGIIQVNIPLGI